MDGAGVFDPPSRPAAAPSQRRPGRPTELPAREHPARRDSAPPGWFDRHGPRIGALVMLATAGATAWGLTVLIQSMFGG